MALFSTGVEQISLANVTVYGQGDGVVLGDALRPLDRFVERRHLPQPEVGDLLLGRKEWSFQDRRLAPGLDHANRSGGRVEPFPPSIMPAVTNAWLNAPISVSSPSLGMVPASLS